MALDLNRKLGPLPVWAWGAGASVGAIGIFLIRRRGSGGAAEAASSGVPEDDGWSDWMGGSVGGYPGGSPGDSPVQPVIVGPAPTPQKDPALVVGPAPAPLVNPSPRSSQPTSTMPVPIGVIQSVARITNPVGYADSEAAKPGNRYRPSGLDYATELPGGITRFQVSQPGQPAGLQSTIYQVPAQASIPKSQLGKVVGAGDRITGERYLDLGGGKYQVIK